MPDDPQEIAARGIDQIGGRRKCFIGDALELLPIAGGLAEALPDLMRNRGAEIRVSENRGR